VIAELEIGLPSEAGKKIVQLSLTREVLNANLESLSPDIH
jgi:hypothetical protein